jgi:NADH:ubiquinone oxidoreductase subunit 2 (subunit N)
MLVLAFITLAGLPPLFFFFSKLSVVAFIVLQSPWYLSVFALILIFWGWFIYLNGVRAISTQSWSFFSSAEFATRYVSTGLPLILVFFFWFLVLGFFAFSDILFFFSWLFV